MTGTVVTSPMRERGFTLVEILVVLIIISILGGIGLGSMRSSRNSASKQEAIAAAHSMQKAIENFRLDREGRVPSKKIVDWTSANGGAALGPMDVDTGRPYMRAAMPESVGFVATRNQSNAISPIASPRPPKSPSPNAYTVTYEAYGNGVAMSTYKITITQGTSTTPICVLSNDAGGTGAC